MRIVVHDYAGHAFQVQLSRELARRGHSVLHLHFTELQTPKGGVVARNDDPPTFEVRGVGLGRPFAKSSIVKRWYQERLYARRLVKEVRTFTPDVVLSANTPLEIQLSLMLSCQRRAIRFVPWVQDLYSVAVATLLAKRFGWLPGNVAGQVYRRIERAILMHSDEVIFIAEFFRKHTAGWGVDPGKCHVIENWAPLDELPLCPRENAWAKRNGLIGKTVLLYAGTLGHKHNPRLLLEVAEAFRGDDRVAVMCVAEGPGCAWLKRERNARRLDNLTIAGLQPYEELPQVLATGDVLIALIEREAGAFAVPSKVLSYLCAARPLLLAVPPENLAAQTVERAGAGLIAEPTDVDGFVAAARRLVANPGLRVGLAASARRYAQNTFDIRMIADRFERVLYPQPVAEAVEDLQGKPSQWTDTTSFSSRVPGASSAATSSRI